MIKKIFIIIILVCSELNSQSSFSFFGIDNNEILNPAFSGLNDKSHFSLESYQSFDLKTKYSNNSTAFGSVFFRDYNFFISYKVNSNIYSGFGLSKIAFDLSYIHKIKINNSLIIYPFLTVNFSQPKKFNDLFFEDQILYGGSTSDPVLINYNPRGYFDFNTGFMIKTEKLYLGLSVNNVTQAKLSSENEEVVRINRNANVSLGYQKEFNNFGIALDGTFSFRPTINSDDNYNEIIFNQEVVFDQFNFGIFQEIFANSFSNDLKNIGFYFSVPIQDLKLGIGFKTNVSKKIRNVDNFIGLLFKYNFSRSINNSINKWEMEEFF